MDALQSSKAYNSDEYSDDELFNNYNADAVGDNTIATVPLSPTARPFATAAQTQKTQATNTYRAGPTSNFTYLTQTTQHLSPSPPPRTSSPPLQSQVQVARSSPAAQTPRGPYGPPLRQGALNGGILASVMAPPGTQYRPPLQRSQPTQATQMSQGLGYSDDERHISVSSDDDDQPPADIRPSLFERGGKLISAGGLNRVEESPKNNVGEFKAIASRFAYNPASIPNKRPADAFMSAQRPSKAPRQTGPSKAQPVDEEPERIEDVPDWGMRQRLEAMVMIYPNVGFAKLYDALRRCRGDKGDALDLIAKEADQEEEDAGADTVDLTQEDDDQPQREKAHVRRDVQAPLKSIASVWGSTQLNSKQPVVHQKPVPQQPGKKRLIRARQQSTSPPAESSPVKAVPQKPKPNTVHEVKRKRTLEEDEEEEAEDSGAGSDLEVEEEDVGEQDHSDLFKFINSSSKEDLLDLSNQSEEVVDLVISKRPFKSIDEVQDLVSTKVSKNGRKQNKKVGDKFVDACIDMWAGYAAVDQLVQKCGLLGNSITDAMKKWGVDSFGKSDGSGELALVHLDALAGHDDSGIGTPSSNGGQEGDDVKTFSGSSKPKSTLFRQPALMSKTLTMKDYQIVGINWLSLLFSKKLSCILADDMGLGKTCQVIAFLAHLYETGVKGPHLIIVPGSTTVNWLREFRNFCPALRVEPYIGKEKERLELRSSIEDERDDINVIVTTYDTASNPKDGKFLRKIVRPVVCVYDEGHALKNSQTKRHQQLMKIPAEFRLLLSGTPVQNNLQELVSILAFLMPKIFREKSEDLAYIFKHKAKTTDKDHAALLSAQRIDRARSMMTPFILRRKKHQVWDQMVKKTKRVEYCDMTDEQNQIVEELRQEAKKALESGALKLDEEDKNQAQPKTSKKHRGPTMTDFRKVALHPLLFRRHYDDATARKMAKAYVSDRRYSEVDEEDVFEDMLMRWRGDFGFDKFCAEKDTPKAIRAMKKLPNDPPPCLNSGKVTKLVELLKQFRSEGHQTLIFSQFTMTLDVLEDVLDEIEMPYSRMDGDTPMEQRQDLIDQFKDVDNDIPVFMMTTRTGGMGLNLETASKVIIFDMSFNPQDDVQAENRAHRLGTKKPVEVIRLVTRGSVEEQILALGESKLLMDDKIAGAASGIATPTGEEAGAKRKEEDELKRLEKQKIGEKLVMERLMEQLKREAEELSKKSGESNGDKKESNTTPSRATPTRKSSQNKRSQEEFEEDENLEDSQPPSSKRAKKSASPKKESQTEEPKTPVRRSSRKSASPVKKEDEDEKNGMPRLRTRRSATPQKDMKEDYLEKLRDAGLDVSKAR